MLPNDPTQKLQNDILRGFMEVLLPSKPTPESIAEAAYRETEDVPSFGPADRFAILLSRINRTMGSALDDDDQAAVIRACRQKVTP